MLNSLITFDKKKKCFEYNLVAESAVHEKEP